MLQVVSDEEVQAVVHKPGFGDLLQPARPTAGAHLFSQVTPRPGSHGNACRDLCQESHQRGVQGNVKLTM